MRFSLHAHYTAIRPTAEVSPVECVGFHYPSIFSYCSFKYSIYKKGSVAKAVNINHYIVQLKNILQLEKLISLCENFLNTILEPNYY